MMPPEYYEDDAPSVCGAYVAVAVIVGAAAVVAGLIIIAVDNLITRRARKRAWRP